LSALSNLTPCSVVDKQKLASFLHIHNRLMTVPGLFVECFEMCTLYCLTFDLKNKYFQKVVITYFSGFWNLITSLCPPDLELGDGPYRSLCILHCSKSIVLHLDSKESKSNLDLCRTHHATSAELIKILHSRHRSKQQTERFWSEMRGAEAS